MKNPRLGEPTPTLLQKQDEYTSAMQAVVDAAARGVRFGKSRLKAHNRIITAGHGVTRAYLKEKAKRVRKSARRMIRRHKRSFDKLAEVA